MRPAVILALIILFAAPAVVWMTGWNEELHEESVPSTDVQPAPPPAEAH